MVSKAKEALALLESELGVDAKVSGAGSRDAPKLKGDTAEYLIGDSVSLADLCWACCLFRLT